MAIDIQELSTFESYTHTTPDADTRAKSRLLSQFSDSIVLNAILTALTTEIQTFLDACSQVINLRQPGGCSLGRLDILGNILDQPRKLVDGTDLTDNQYKSMLYALSIKNRSRFCSVPEIQRYTKLLFGDSVSFEMVGPMEANISVPSGSPTDMEVFLTAKWTDKRVDNKFYMNYPATLRINGLDNLRFTPDDADRCADIGIGEV